ncbi:MAG: YdeI family protein [Caldilineaceae bacterium]
MTGTNPKVDFFFRQDQPWQAAFEKLRAIVLDCGLTEVLKWGQPCYTLENRNIVLMHGFKEYCALLFFKGTLLKDPQGILIQQTANVQAARQIRFTNVQEITAMEPILKAYIAEAIAVEKAGLNVPLKETADFPMPEEFINTLEEVPGLQDAFDALTPGRQRAYLLHFSAPKQAKTRVSRIEKCVPQILKGKGLTDE